MTIHNKNAHKDNKGRLTPFTLARVIEGTVRSVNNLVERFHQSFYYYLLISPHQFISIGNYMLSLGLIILGYWAYVSARPCHPRPHSPCRAVHLLAVHCADLRAVALLLARDRRASGGSARLRSATHRAPLGRN